MKRAYYFLFALATASALAQKTDYTTVYQSDSLLSKGVALYESKQYEASLKEYRKVDALDPNYIRAQYEIGMSLFALEKKDTVQQHLERLYKGDYMKKLPSLYTMYGSFLSDEKRYDEAEQVFKEGLKVIPNATNHLYNMAILYYRKGEKQKCIDLLEKIIAQNPNSASSHYLLGSLAFESGKIVEGTMAMLSYLVILPNGKYAKDAIIKMNAKYGDNYLEKNDLVFSKTGDNFEELETILRNQLPLRNAYKIESNIDDVVTRQVQAVIEYTQTHTMGDGFFETTYIPWLKALADAKQIEGFSYYMLISLENDLGKKLTAQKKKITQFTEEFIGNGFWPKYAGRKLDIFGTNQDVVVYLNGGTPNLVGSMVNGKREGRFKLLNKYENLDGELQFVNNELQGLQKYYNEEGKVEEEKNYDKGKLEGKRKVYYPNGNISLEENYHEGKLDGVSTSYLINGGVNCTGTFSKGEPTGSMTCYYSNGSKKNEGNYSQGKQDGVYTSYNKVGDINFSQSYKNGVLNGKYTKYFDGKQIEEEAEYVNGQVADTFKRYYSNKQLKEEHHYKEGKRMASTEYYPTGVKSSESTYNEKGEILGTTYFDAKGERYYDELFNSKEIKYIKQYTRNNPKPTEINLSRKSFEIKTLDNTLVATGSFEKGRRNGEWKNYYNSGLLHFISNYEKGNKEGLMTLYDDNGGLNAIRNYKNDTLQGRNDVFNDRGLHKTYYFNHGDLNGPFKQYYPDGKVMTAAFFKNDELSGLRQTYNQAGQLVSEDNFYEGELMATTLFDRKGLKEGSTDYVNKTGPVSFERNGGIITQNFSLKNGCLDGLYLRKIKNNKPLIEAEYSNGVLQHTYKLYGPNDTILDEYPYYNGLLNGVMKAYDLTGNLKITTTYTFGDENGPVIRYYHNKAKMYEYLQIDNNKEGDFTYYNQEGEPLVVITYLENIPLYYMKRSKTGQLTEKVVLENGTGQVASNYANGKLAIQFRFDKGNKEGAFVINNAKGTPEYTSFYKGDIVTNERIEYYANGQIYLKEHFVLNDYEGLQEYFKEDGKPWIKANYKNDELHGPTQLYTNGVLTTTKTYDSDFLVDLTK